MDEALKNALFLSLDYIAKNGPTPWAEKALAAKQDLEAAISAHERPAATAEHVPAEHPPEPASV